MAYSTSFAMAKTSSRVVSIPWAVRPCSCTAATTSSSVPRVCQPHWQVTSFIVCFSSFLQHTQYGHITSISEEVKSEHLPVFTLLKKQEVSISGGWSDRVEVDLVA